MAARGAYAKGVAKREEIARATVEVIERVGFRHAGIREIAEAVGLSQTGLLHYYESREALLVDVLRRRDEAARSDAATSDDDDPRFSIEALHDWLIAQAQRNQRARGLVHLFAQLSVDAADPAHPAAAFFLERDARLNRDLAQIFDRAQREKRISTDVDPAALAMLTHAVIDGMQLQFLANPDIDLVAAMRAFSDLLAVGAPVDEG